jgi:uncharacterized protein YggU (UPF0235/DUF167 family)
VRVTVRVHPGSVRTKVGGRWGESEPAVLEVRVSAPATGGRANRAVAEALGAAFAVPTRSVVLMAGGRGRTKVFDVPGADPTMLQRLLSA